LRVEGLGFRVQGSGFRVQGSGFRVQGLGLRVLGLGFRVLRCTTAWRWGRWSNTRRSRPESCKLRTSPEMLACLGVEALRGHWRRGGTLPADWGLRGVGVMVKS
jgi:hypothetical protein